MRLVVDVEAVLHAVRQRLRVRKGDLAGTWQVFTAGIHHQEPRVLHDVGVARRAQRQADASDFDRLAMILARLGKEVRSDPLAQELAQLVGKVRVPVVVVEVIPLEHGHRRIAGMTRVKTVSQCRTVSDLICTPRRIARSIMRQKLRQEVLPEVRVQDGPPFPTRVAREPRDARVVEERLNALLETTAGTFRHYRATSSVVLELLFTVSTRTTSGAARASRALPGRAATCSRPLAEVTLAVGHRANELVQVQMLSTHVLAQPTGRVETFPASLVVANRNSTPLVDGAYMTIVITYRWETLSAQ